MIVMTYADCIFCEEDKIKTESGDIHLIKLYHKLNKIFPEKHNVIRSTGQIHVIKIPTINSEGKEYYVSSNI